MHISLGKDSMMVKVEDIQSYGKEHLETAAASASNLQSGVQAIATAYGDYAKKSFEDTKSFVEKLSGVKSLDKAIEAQTEYAKLGLRDLRCGVAEDRRPLHRSRQADLQAVRGPGREVHPGRARLISPEHLQMKKPGRNGRAFFLSNRYAIISRRAAWRSA